MSELNSPFKHLQPPDSDTCAAYTSAQIAHIFGMDAPYSDPFKIQELDGVWQEDPDGGRHFRTELFNEWFMDEGGKILSHGPFPWKGKEFNPKKWNELRERLVIDVEIDFFDSWEEIEAEAEIYQHPNFNEIIGVPKVADVMKYLGRGALVSAAILKEGSYGHSVLLFEGDQPYDVPSFTMYDPPCGNLIIPTFALIDGEEGYTPEAGVFVYEVS